MPVSVAARIFSRSCIGSLAIASRLPDSTVLNGSTFASSGFALTTRRHAVQAVHHLRVHRVLDPQRAVLVEGGDARLAAARTSGSPASVVACTNSTIAFFAGAVVPGGQRVGLRMRRDGTQRERQAGEQRMPATRDNERTPGCSSSRDSFSILRCGERADRHGPPAPSRRARARRRSLARVACCPSS